MKCKVCGKKTNWDNSYGRPKFIVCPTCHNKIAKIIKNITNSKYSDVTASSVILEMGFIREKGE